MMIDGSGSPYFFELCADKFPLSMTATASAQSPTPQSPIMRQESQLKPSETRERLSAILGDGDRVTVSQVTEAILKLICDDLKVISLNRINPMSIRGVVTRPPLSSALADWTELRLGSLLHQESSIEIRECISCKQRSFAINSTSIVLSQGDRFIASKSTLKDDTKIQSFLELGLFWSPQTQRLIAKARLYDHSDQLIWSEDYRSGDEGDLAKRGVGDIEEETSMATYGRLASINQPKILTLSEILLGYGLRSGQIIGTPSLIRLGYGYGVFFGESHQFSLFFDSLLSFSFGQLFFDVNADFRYRITSAVSSSKKSDSKGLARAASQGFWLKGIFGVPFSQLISGTLLGVGAHYMSEYKVGVGISTSYSFNFEPIPRVIPLGGFGADINLLYQF